MASYRNAAGVLALLCGVWLKPAQAVGPYVPIEERARAADLIVEGRVIGVISVMVEGRTVSDITLAIDGTIKASDYDAPTITFRTPGGTVDGVESYPEEAEHFVGNERLIVLLTRKVDGWWNYVPW